MSDRRIAVACLTAVLFLGGGAVRSAARDFEAERSRVEAQRLEQTQQLDALEQACYAKFAVTDCVNRVRTQRRQHMALLDQQLAQINSAQRVEQAQQRRQSRSEKIAQRELRDAERLVTVAATNPVPPSDFSTSAPQRLSGDFRAIDHVAKSEGRPDTANREAGKARFIKKQQDAQERRRLRDQRLQEPSPPHLALPVPP